MKMPRVRTHECWKEFLALAFTALTAAIASQAGTAAASPKPPQFPLPVVREITPNAVPAGWEGQIVLIGTNFPKDLKVRLDCNSRAVAIRSVTVENAMRAALNIRVPSEVEASRCVMVLEVPSPMTAEISPSRQGTPQIVQVTGPSFSISGSSGSKGARAACSVNLLTAADPARDAVNGRWRFENEELLSDGSPAARLGFAAVPPEEYDLRVEFTRIEGRDSVVLILAKGTRRFVLEMGGWDGIAGFALIDGRNVDSNPTKIRFPVTNGQRYSVLVRVRNDRLEAVIDGQAKFAYPTDFRSLTLNPDWSLPGKPGLGLGSFASSTRFHVAELMPSPCGPTGVNPAYTIPSATQSAGGSLSGYVHCARENGRCQFNGVADVAYGADGKFTFKYGLQNGVDCNNGVFGDPVVGVVKDCLIKQSAVDIGPRGSLSGYVHCARENGRCQFNGVADVAYGANDKFTFKYGLQNGVDCNNGVFGDPIVGVVKDCFIKRSFSP